MRFDKGHSDAPGKGEGAYLSSLYSIFSALKCPSSRMDDSVFVACTLHISWFNEFRSSMSLSLSIL